MLVLLAVQTSAIAPAEAERVVIDIAVPAPCPDQDDAGFDDEILVCAKRDGEDRYRVSGAQAQADPALPRAEVALSDGSTLSAETESADLGMARPQRLMVHWKIKF